MKYTKKRKLRQKGRGIIPNIKATTRIGSNTYKYIKKCPPGKVMCDKNEVNYSLCVNNEDECKNVEYPFRYNKEEGEYNPNHYKRFEFELDPTEEYKEYELVTDLLNNDIQLQEQTARLKSYVPEYLLTSCYIQQKTSFGNTYLNENISSIVPSPFSIITQNALGLYFGKQEDYYLQQDTLTPSEQKQWGLLKLMKLRTAYLRKYLQDLNYPDFLCFQEMTQTFLKLLDNNELKNNYGYHYPTDEEFEQIIKNGSDATVMLISKYPARKSKTYQLQGNSNYYNALGVYEFDNLVIINVYLQAGSVISPGLKYNWDHYSRCRRQQLVFIKSIIDEHRGKPVVVLGDFNFELNSLHYDGTPDDTENWAESQFLRKFELVDSFKNLYPNDPGLTENTEINTLRLLGKLEEKALRYDGIFMNDKLRPIESKVITDIPLKLTNDNLRMLAQYNDGNIVYENMNDANRDYENVLVFRPPNPEKTTQLENILREHNIKQDDGTNIFELFVSDHFGVMTTFEIVNNTTGGKRKTKRRLKYRRKNKSQKRK